MALKRKVPAQQLRDEGASGTLKEGEWNCAKCSVKNFSARVACFKCSLSKQESEIRLKGKAALDWDCFKCKAKNFSFRSSCFKCQIPKLESDIMKARREGIPWVCRFCQLENRVTNSQCFKCKKSREFADVNPPLPPRRPLSPPPMMMPRYSGPDQRIHDMRALSPPRHPQGRNLPMDRRLLPAPPSRPISPLNKVPGFGRPGVGAPEWRCLLCCTNNVLARSDCYKCTTPRGSKFPPSAGPAQSRVGKVSEKPALKDGEWKCLPCDVINYKFRKECFKCKAKKPEDAGGLSITINNDKPPEPNPAVVLNHSMVSEEPSPMKRRRLDYGEGPGLAVRPQWGPDWICGYCRVDIHPARIDCFKCGRHRDVCELRGERVMDPRNMGPRDMGPRDMGPRDMGTRDMGPRDMGPRDMGPRDMGPRDMIPLDMGLRNMDHRDMGPRFDPRDRHGPDGYICSCGNFNRIFEPDCVKCGRPNDRGRIMQREGPPGRDIWRDGPISGGGRSPPRFYNEAPRGVGQNSKVAQAKRAAQAKKKAESAKEKGKAVKKDRTGDGWMCKDCQFHNFVKRTECLKCHKKKSEVEDKDAVIPTKDEMKEPAMHPWGGKTMEEVFAEYVALYEDYEGNDKKFEKGKVVIKTLFKAKRIAMRILKKTEKEDVQEDIDKAKKVYETLVKLHGKVHKDLNINNGWKCEAADCDAFNFKHRITCFKCSVDKPASLETAEQGDDEAEASAEETMPEDSTGKSETPDEVMDVTSVTDAGDVSTNDEDITIPDPTVDFKTDY